MGDDAEPAARADALIDADAGRRYWQGVEADVNGMLGGIPSMQGFESISRIDLQGSRAFLARLGVGVKSGGRRVARALEGGAGIGRVTQGLLLPVAERVDVIEPMCKFTDALKDTPGVGTVFNVGLEEWQPDPDALYDLVWTQWCLGHVTDAQMVRHLERCKTLLRPGSGFIVVKENLSTTDADVFDETDSSVTRHDDTYQRIFEKAGLVVVRSEMQRGFPAVMTMSLLPVKMYALRPRS